MTVIQPGSLRVGIIGRTLRLMLALLFGWMSFTTMRLENTTSIFGFWPCLWPLACYTSFFILFSPPTPAG
jgi:hypothetical protein